MSAPNEIDRGPLFIVPENIAAELRTKSALQGVTIIVADPKELVAEIDQKVATAKGLLVLVEPPSGTNGKPGVFGTLNFDDVRIGVSVTESPLLNRGEGGTGLHALRVLFDVMRALHGYRPPGAGQMLACVEFGPVEDFDLLIYRAGFRTAVNLGSDADLAERRPL